MNRTMDLLFTDSFAFAINATLGTLLRSKICNYSWDEETKKDKATEETNDPMSIKHKSEPFITNHD